MKNLLYGFMITMGFIACYFKVPLGALVVLVALLMIFFDA